MRILHLAPERGIYNRLKPLVGAGYQTADFNPDHYKSVDPDCFFIDLCELDDQPSDNFDLIIHSHVMEHIPCNMAYTLWNLHRMLKPTGRHVCIIPFLGGYHDETFAEIGGENRARRFGQNDHVRRFGREDLQRGLGAILTLPTTFDQRSAASRHSARAVQGIYRQHGSEPRQVRDEVAGFSWGKGGFSWGKGVAK